MIIAWQGMRKKSIRYCIAYVIVWALTAYLAMIGAMGRKTVPIIMFASIYAIGVDVFLMDEPSANLDIEATKQLRRTISIRFYATNSSNN